MVNEYLPQWLSNQNTMHPVSYNVLMPFAYTGTGAAPAVLKKQCRKHGQTAHTRGGGGGANYRAGH